MDILESGLLNKNSMFWLVFALIGVFLFFRLPLIEVIVGILVVFLGIYKIAEELDRRKAEHERTSIQKTLEDIRDWMEREHKFVKLIEGRYDNRFFQSNKKRIDVEKKLDKNYRDLTRKLLQIDNKLMDISRAFLSWAPRIGSKK